MIEEIFLPVVGFEDFYKVSNFGRLLSFNKKKARGIGIRPPRILKPTNNSAGYPHCQLWKDGKIKDVHIHKIVAVAFIPNPNNYPIINHIDGCPNNNKIENLEWCTQKHNAQHACDMGLSAKGEKHYLSKVTDMQALEIRKIYNESKMSHRKIAFEYGVSSAVIGRIIRRESRNYLKS
jgi:hypothetical protein